jgi:hypothetical protein
MRRLHGFKLLLALLAVIAALPANSALACAMCYANGNADSPLTQGMNWGIFSLLAMVVCVLATIAGFFIYLARKSAALTAQGEALASTQKA